jgi:hypothetical protein
MRGMTKGDEGEDEDESEGEDENEANIGSERRRN